VAGLSATGANEPEPISQGVRGQSVSAAPAALSNNADRRLTGRLPSLSRYGWRFSRRAPVVLLSQSRQGGE